MENQRTAILIGEEKLQILKQKNIIVFGLGGVGSYVVEALSRVGIGKITIVDFDKVDVTNLNRQLIALHSTIGQKKIEVSQKRIKDINPNIDVVSYDTFVSPSTIEQFDFKEYDFIIDCIDNVTGKLLIIEKAISLSIPIISAMGTANKLDPSKLLITDISKTSMCPLAKVMRLELRKRGINHLKVLFSNEEPKPVVKNTTVLGSISFVPSTGGLLIAGYVINQLIENV